jgi:hypothetical protein
VTWGMVGPYSLTSPWEWHSDQLMASVYNRIDRGVGEHHNRAYRKIASLLRARMLQTVRGQWYRYDYRNAAGTSIDRELARQFELTAAELETLVDRYVIPLADVPMLSKALALDSDSLVAAKLSESLSQSWVQMRERVEQTPDVGALVHYGMGPWRGANLGGGGDQLDEPADEPEEGAVEGEAAVEGEGEAAVEGEPTSELPEPPLDPAAESGESPSEGELKPERGGAGRVGGEVRDEAADPPAIVGDSEPVESEDRDTRARRIVDPVLLLLERLHEEPQ